MWSPRVGAISLSLLVLTVCWDITTVGSPNNKLHSNTEVRHSKEGGQGELRVGTRQDDTMAELWEYIGQHPATVSGPRPLRQTWRRRTPDVVRRWSRWNVHAGVPMFSLHSLGNSTSQSFNTRVTHTSSNKRPRSTSSSILVSAFSSAFSSRPSSRPSSTFSSRPSSTFSSTFSSRPSSTFSSRPSSTFSSRPSSTFSSRPSSTFSSRPSSTFSSRPSSTFSSRPSSTFPTTSSLPKARRLVTVEPGYLLVMTKARPSKGGADADDLIFVPETEQVRVDSLQETSLKKGADSDEEQSTSEKPLVLQPFSKTTDKGKTPSWTSKSNSSNFNNVSKFYGYINNKVNDEAGVTPAVTRVTLMTRTTSPFQGGDGGEGGRAAVDVSETVITRNSERPATASGTEDSISSAVFISDLPGRRQSHQPAWRYHLTRTGLAKDKTL
ncbi:factor-induced gene 2 protein-like [Pomacea canaliculata]|uniref:factor-induced gene 2 protein-like n=1 Tax=Pomacea canaliculata TaxID=400727 RepID=UPI000D730D05|nr:factor-induced gene 2 protein-like [Pomacea canaliculata]XP_025105650.1 factor-induced gene 2 protein-like [Pomacea canaliculata]XP_025105659.1 factor-induced gene 2 protein-like [Pomacea canaliculata]XP_025105668.1 factor-induced gene 2 protein-like [Pomacea canaliculata]